MTPERGDKREREISPIKKWGLTIWLFSGVFGVIILFSSSTPVGLYLGWLLIFVSFIVLVIWAFWYIAGRADEFVGRKWED